MSYRLFPAIGTFVLSIILLIAPSCVKNQETLGKIDLAEKLMESHPDSALSILNSIKSSKLSNPEEKARYALLLSIALDKNYIDTTTFDVIKPAIDYYAHQGSPDEKFRTLYYKGRIFQNQGNEDSAMREFVNAIDLKREIKDSLLLAHNYVALATLYFKQYKIGKFITNNLEAAKLYGRYKKKSYELMSYVNALDGYIILNDRPAADNVLSMCITLANEIPGGYDILFPSLLSYTIEFGTESQIKDFLSTHNNRELSQDDVINFAQGYSLIGNHEKAIDLISNLKIEGSCFDSLKYLSVKTGIFEKHGDYEQALRTYKQYSSLLENYQKHLLSQDLLFTEEKHKLEIKNLLDLKKREGIIWGIALGAFGLLLLSGWLYYRYRLSTAKRLLTESENDNLRLSQENLNKEKERVELERDIKILEAQNLEQEKKQLETERLQRELEAANLLLEKKQLEEERDNLRKLLERQTELSIPIQDVIKTRLEMLNSLLAKEITHNNNYAKPYNKWIESVHKDKGEFMNSTRLAFTASHPRFIAYLEQHNLTIDEINYLCLYAIGLRGKEVGEYIQLKRHYNISSEIRKKIGIDEHETNIGPFIRRKMNEL